MHVRPIVASFVDDEQVRRALDRLRAADIRRDAVAMLMAEPAGGPQFGLMTGTKLSEGLAFGAALGGLLGAALAPLVVTGDVLGAGLGPAIAALAGAGIGGGIGSIVGAVFGLGAPEYRAKLVDGPGRGGRILVAVWVEDDAQAEQVAEAFSHNES